MAVHNPLLSLLGDAYGDFEASDSSAEESAPMLMAELAADYDESAFAQPMAVESVHGNDWRGVFPPSLRPTLLSKKTWKPKKRVRWASAEEGLEKVKIFDKVRA